jgi:putative oxidoreductase
MAHWDIARWEPLVRRAAGVVFVFAGLAKFIFYGGELHAFERYGLPAPEAFVVLIGVVELGGGVLLLLDRLTRSTALVLAAVMAAAIGLSGIGRDEVIPSLTLAPILLTAMLYVLWVPFSRRARR